MSGVRRIDPELGELAGEGALLDADAPRTQALQRAEPAPDVENRPRDAERPTSYYGLPVVKPPPWRWYIPAYFYFGGLAGAAAALGAASQRSEALRPLTVRARWLGLASLGAGSALLVADLGRPTRALNMLRVFRPTSAMNLGTWIIGFTGISLAASATAPRRAGDVAGLAAGASGLVLSTYTAAVLSNTAIPVWRNARRTLPFLFAAGAAASAGSMLQLVDLERPGESTVDRLAMAGKLAELAAVALVERDLGPVGRPLREGKAGWMWSTGKALGVASIVAALLPGKRRPRVASGVLGTAAAVLLRLALHEAGRASARDPHATMHPSRRSLNPPGRPPGTSGPARSS